jgi:uncharacterized protein (DUF2267 family)
VLAAFLDAVPEGERRHLLEHLPEDVVELTHPPRRVGSWHRPRSAGEFVVEVAEACGRTVGTAEQVTGAVLGTLHDLVPEEVRDLEAVLPRGVRALWDGAPHRR